MGSQGFDFRSSCSSTLKEINVELRCKEATPIDSHVVNKEEEEESINIEPINTSVSQNLYIESEKPRHKHDQVYSSKRPLTDNIKHAQGMKRRRVEMKAKMPLAESVKKRDLFDGMKVLIIEASLGRTRCRIFRERLQQEGAVVK
eukprot:Ihof_evm24s1 gene=Ihof_evmTU24s1